MDPFEDLAFAGLRCAFPAAAGEEWHQQVEVVVAVTGESEWCEAARPSIDAEFFLQFADQGDFGRFALFYFAARKFPEPRERFSLGALGEEDPPVCVDESYGRDEQRFHER